MTVDDDMGEDLDPAEIEIGAAPGVEGGGRRVWFRRQAVKQASSG